MIIKAEVEIEIDDEDLENWIKAHSDHSRDYAVSEVEGMEYPDEVSGLRMMLRFSSAKEE